MTTSRAASPDRRVPEDPLAFIVRCVRERRVYWTYHVNMRLAGRHISREDICGATDTYELVDAYPDDKYRRATSCWRPPRTRPFTYCSRRTWQMTA